MVTLVFKMPPPNRLCPTLSRLSSQLAAACLACLAQPATAHASSLSPTPGDTLSGYGWIVVLLGGVLGGSVLRLGMNRSHERQAPGSAVRQILEAGHKLAQTDCAALTHALTELAHGNLAAHVRLQSEPLRLDGDPQIKEWVGVFNSIVANLSQCAKEFNLVTETPCHRLCYVGADSFLEGRACGEAMGRLLGRQAQVGVITGLASSVSLELRRKGFQTLLAEKHPGIQIVNVSHGPEGPEPARERATALLAEYPGISGIYVTNGSGPPGVAQAVVEAGKGGQIKIVAHDLVDDTMRHLQQGTIAATLGQDPFAQGHDPIIHLFNHLAAGWQPPAPRLLTQMDLVTQENCAQFWQPGRGVITSAEAVARHAKPMSPRVDRPLRLVCLGRVDSKFWEPVRDGVATAAAELSAYKTGVEWIVPEQNRKSGEIGEGAYGPLLEEMIRQRVDGLAIGVYDVALVPYINKASRAGIPVVTLNCEPGGLRSMVLLTAGQAARLMTLSQQLASAVDHVGQATLQISASMDQVSQGTISQAEQVSHTRESLTSLLNHIDEVSQEAKEGATAAEATAHAATAGTEAVEKTLASMRQIQTAVADTGKTVESLSQHSQKIDIILKLISAIAYQIKLLGINAAIEAAHAGSYGAGFSVVAGEIRGLADRTAKATGEIADVVKAVKSGINEVQKVMAGGLDRVKSGADLAAAAGKVLTEIRQSVEANRSRLASIAAAVTQMQSFSHQVGEVVENVAASSEENAAAIEEVGASTKEALSQLEEVSALAQSLAEMARGQQQLMAKFDIADEGA